jgi:hypothetical protein
MFARKPALVKFRAKGLEDLDTRVFLSKKEIAARIFVLEEPRDFVGFCMEVNSCGGYKVKANLA